MPRHAYDRRMNRQRSNERAADTLVFVYGTLKRGYWNHTPWLDGCEYLRDTMTKGRLWVRRTLTPILEIPVGHHLLRGTADVRADVAAAGALGQARGRIRAARPLPPDALPKSSSGSASDMIPTDMDHFLWVTGELYRLTDPSIQLPRLDELEEFVPEDAAASLYDRQLAPVDKDGQTLAWLYPIPSGRQPIDYQPARNPSEWRGEIELPPDYFAARQRGESPEPPVAF